MATDIKKITTPPGRLSYPEIFKPTQFEGKGEFYFSTQLLIPKSLEASNSYKQFAAFIKSTIDAAHPQGRPEGFQLPIKDGDTTDRAECQGHWIVTARRNTKDDPSDWAKDAPAVYGMNGQPVMDQSEIYAGCVAVLNVSAYCWNVAGRHGCRLTLFGVKKVQDAERFGGGVEFDDVNSGDLAAFGSVATAPVDDPPAF